MDRDVIFFKICMLGSQGVGKSSIVGRITSNKFRSNMFPTVGAAFSSITLDIDNHLVRFHIWDTAGQERFKSLIPMYYRKTNVAIIVFDITCLNSYEEVASWAEELKAKLNDEFVLCVIGNKSDLESKRTVDKKKALNFASSLGAMYFETSAKTSDGVRYAFVQMARRLILLNEPHKHRRNFHSTTPYEKSKVTALEKSYSPQKTSFCCV